MAMDVPLWPKLLRASGSSASMSCTAYSDHLAADLLASGSASGQSKQPVSCLLQQCMQHASHSGLLCRCLRRSIRIRRGHGKL